MNPSIACRYPRWDSGERRLASTEALELSRSGRPNLAFSRANFFLSFFFSCISRLLTAGHENRRVVRDGMPLCVFLCYLFSDEQGHIDSQRRESPYLDKHGADER